MNSYVCDTLASQEPANFLCLAITSNNIYLTIKVTGLVETYTDQQQSYVFQSISGTLERMLNGANHVRALETRRLDEMVKSR